MKRVGICIRRDAEKLLHQCLDLLQQAVGPIAGFVTRDHAPDVSIEHPIGVLFDTDRLPAFAPFDNNLYLSVVLPLCLQDPSERPNGIDLLGLWLINGRVVLRREEDVALAGHRLFERPDG